MPERHAAPSPLDLHRLARQIDADRARSMAELRRRDHEIGRDCVAGDDVARLKHWLECVAGPAAETRQRERGVVALMRVLALFLGLMTMLGFLLASDRALVNVLVFLLVFVLLQLVFSLVSGTVLLRALRGAPAPGFSLNPAWLAVKRALPEGASPVEYGAAGRLLLLRYGQEFGALFTLGALAGFLGALAFVDFSFVWGSTFGLGDRTVESAVNTIAYPWSGVVPAATVSPEVIAETRFQAVRPDLGAVSDASRRGWWPFLLMCLAVYALLPRTVLWLASRLAFNRELRRAFAGLPGAEAVLSRMRAPSVTTRALEKEAPDAEPPIEIDEGVMLLNWAGALTDADYDRLNGLARVPAANRYTAGLGAPEDDEAVVAAISRYRPEILLVAVRAWEPPLADLADVVGALHGVTRCTLCLVPLPKREVSEHSREEWNTFCRQLPVPAADCEPLSWK